MRNSIRFVILFRLIALPASTLWTTEKASCDATFSNCQIPENVVVQLPFLGIAGDVIIQDPNSPNVSDVFRILNNIVDTGGGTGLGNLAILYSADDPRNKEDDESPLPSTHSANARTITEAASGATVYFGNGTNYHLDTSAAATRLVYTGDTTGDYHDPANLSAVLTLLATGAAIPNATVTFTLGSQSCAGTTNAAGAANCSVVLGQRAGNYRVAAGFGGVFGADAGSTASRAFSITLEETALSYTGDPAIVNGATAHLSGVLLEDNTTAIAGRTVTFTLGSGASAQSCAGVTDATGKAGCAISSVNQTGAVVVTGSFAGDPFYRSATVSANLNGIGIF